MRRLTLLVAAATARPDANATEYFDAASRLWPPTSTPRMARRRSGGSIRPSCRDCWRRVRNRSRPFTIVSPVRRSLRLRLITSRGPPCASC